MIYKAIIWHENKPMETKEMNILGILNLTNIKPGYIVNHTFGTSQHKLIIEQTSTCKWITITDKRQRTIMVLKTNLGLTTMKIYEILSAVLNELEVRICEN